MKQFDLTKLFSDLYLAIFLDILINRSFHVCTERMVLLKDLKF